VELKSIKDLPQPSNVQLQYTFQVLGETKSFRTSPAVAVQAGREGQIKNGFASFEFKLDSQGIKPLLESTIIPVKVMHVQSGTATELSSVDIALKDLLRGKLVSTPQSEVRVFDAFHAMENGGSLRAILYLEDIGEVEDSLPAEVTSLRYQQQENKDPNGAAQNDLEKQVIWQLQLWKRQEENKFKAYLQQREVERIEEVTREWQQKEADRNGQLLDSIQQISALEAQLR